MNMQAHKNPADTDSRKELLQEVYRVYSDWVECFPLACQKGCAACCTQSVTMTSLEGELILDFIRKMDLQEWLQSILAEASPGRNRPKITTNQFARACLEQRDIDPQEFPDWDFTPCVFLDRAVCTIYEVRPFGCRCFGSQAKCDLKGTSEMAPIHLTVNTVFNQIIEHLSSGGGYWANMTDILHCLRIEEYRAEKNHLLEARPVPGFLLEPEEVGPVSRLLKKIAEECDDKKSTGDLIDNFIGIL